MDDMFGSQVGAAGLAVYVIQWLKNNPKLSWISSSTDRLNRVLSALLAALATVGIRISFDAVSGVLTVSGLELGTILSLLWNWVIQLILQEILYKGAVKDR